MRIVKAPSGVLNRVADKVTVFDTELLKLIRNMTFTMIAFHGVGLAAPQVGISKRIIVVNLSGKLKAMINPEILIKGSIEKYEYEECLSIPKEKVLVKRSESIQIKYMDKHGNTQIENYIGFHARIVQHEIDHLNGILITNYK